MAKVMVGVLFALLLAGCGLSLHHSASITANVPRLCQDGLPILVLQALTCPNGFCGYTCDPHRWDKPCVP